MNLRLIATLALLTSPLLAQDLTRVPPTEQAEAARQFKLYRESKDLAEREKAADALAKMHYTVLQQLAPLVERDWTNTVNAYTALYRRSASDVAKKRSMDNAWKKDVATHRETMKKLRSAGDALTKEQIVSQGDPAMKRLGELFTISKADLAGSAPSLALLGDSARTFTRVRAMLKKKTRLKDEREFTEDDIAKSESSATARAFRADQKTENTLAANAEMTAKNAVPADEAAGIAGLNHMRMLCGLDPVLIDPKLHNAARDHSKDMAEKGFFAHESPVPGKKTPWDRAKLAGTNAGAENIFAGSPSPDAANQGWFHSPGHHVNMFGNHRRGAMGRFQGHWTQMFGG